MASSLVHIGDFHAAVGPRNEARYAALDQIIDAALQLPELGAWLWPGDLSHQRQAIADELAIIARVKRMADRAPVVICRGNHDVEGDLDKLAFIGAAHPVYVVNMPQVLRIRLATMQFASIAVLPYPHRAGLVVAGVPSPDVVDAAADALEHIFIDFALQLEAAREKGDYLAFIGHVNVGGAIASTGQPNIGREIELSPRHLERLRQVGDVYLGLNHIHRPQKIHGAHYAGSVCRLDFGEIEEKRWLEVQLLDEGYHVVSHPIDVAPMGHIEGHLTRDGFTWAMKAGPGGEKQDPPASFKGWEVRVRYTFAQSEASVLDKTLVKRPFADAALVHPDPIAVPDRALRAPEVAAAKTLADKVAAWCVLSGTVATDGVLQKLAQLEKGDPNYVISGAEDDALDILHGARDEQIVTAA